MSRVFHSLYLPVLWLVAAWLTSLLISAPGLAADRTCRAEAAWLQQVMPGVVEQAGVGAVGAPVNLPPPLARFVRWRDCQLVWSVMATRRLS